MSFYNSSSKATRALPPPSTDVLHATLAIDNISITLIDVRTPTFNNIEERTIQEESGKSSCSSPNASHSDGGGGIASGGGGGRATAIVTYTQQQQRRPRCPFTHISVCFERVNKKGSRTSTRWASTLYPQIGDDIDNSNVNSDSSPSLPKNRVLYFGTISTFYFPIQVKAESSSALEKMYRAVAAERHHASQSPLGRYGSSLMSSAASTLSGTTTTNMLGRDRWDEETTVPSTTATPPLLSVASKTKHPLVCTIRCFDIEKAKMDFETAEGSYFQQRKPFYNAKVTEFTSGIEVDIAGCINSALAAKKKGFDCHNQNNKNNDHYHYQGAESSIFVESSSPSPLSATATDQAVVINADGSITYTTNVMVSPAVLRTLTPPSTGPVTIRLQFTVRCEQLSTDEDITRESESVEAIIKKVKLGLSSAGQQQNDLTPSQVVVARQLDDVLHDGDTNIDDEPFTGIKGGGNPPTLFSLRMYNSRRSAAISEENETVVRGGGRPTRGQPLETIFPYYEEPLNFLDPSNSGRCIATNESFMTAANSSSANNMILQEEEEYDERSMAADLIPGGSDSAAFYVGQDNKEEGEGRGTSSPHGGGGGNSTNGNSPLHGGGWKGSTSSPPTSPRSPPSSLTGILRYVHPITLSGYLEVAEERRHQCISPSVPTPLIPSFTRNRHNTHTYHDYCIILDSIYLNVGFVTAQVGNIISSYGIGFFADTTLGTPANRPPFVCPRLMEPDAQGHICFAPAEGASISFQDQAAATAFKSSEEDEEHQVHSHLASPHEDKPERSNIVEKDVEASKSWCIFSCRSGCYSNIVVGRREIVTSRFKTVGGGADEATVGPIPPSSLITKSVMPAGSSNTTSSSTLNSRSQNRKGGGGLRTHNPVYSTPATLVENAENGMCKSSQRAKLVFTLVRVSKDKQTGAPIPCSEAATFQALDLASEVLNVENYPHDGLMFRVRFNYGEMLQFRLRRRCFRAPLVHLSALLEAPPPLAPSPTLTAATSPNARTNSHHQSAAVSVGSSFPTTTQPKAETPLSPFPKKVPLPPPLDDANINSNTSHPSPNTVLYSPQDE